MMPLVTIMGLVTTSTRSGRVSSILMVRRIGRAVCRQPQPVGLGATWRMPNKLRKIPTRHTLCGQAVWSHPANPSGKPCAARTVPIAPADCSMRLLLGSRGAGSVPVQPPRRPKPRRSLTKTQQSSKNIGVNEHAVPVS
jgi:hypothetical protein